MIVDHISRRTPGVIKRFAAGQQAVIIGDHVGVPRGTVGTVQPVDKDGLMLWFRSGPTRVALVNNDEVDEYPPVPPCQRCGLRPADGSRIMCQECWVETGDGL